jgi:hypothetical protein
VPGTREIGPLERCAVVGQALHSHSLIGVASRVGRNQRGMRAQL